MLNLFLLRVQNRIPSFVNEKTFYFYTEKNFWSLPNHLLCRVSTHLTSSPTKKIEKGL